MIKSRVKIKHFSIVGLMSPGLSPDSSPDSLWPLLDSDSDSDPLDSDSVSGPMDSDSDSGPMDSDSGLMDLDSVSGLVDSDSRVRTHSNTELLFMKKQTNSCQDS